MPCNRNYASIGIGGVLTQPSSLLSAAVLAELLSVEIRHCDDTSNNKRPCYFGRSHLPCGGILVFQLVAF
ncbi:hypothetical protein MRB53_014135 [Persea americana]|uniref:Uncharacterized protein n=1 Tax=Persea americana TaxID=3435 RepID=A0ACC2K9X8_PERAE|nr:hypothetical protein MRB53_014135 [Persea americana]